MEETGVIINSAAHAKNKRGGRKSLAQKRNQLGNRVRKKRWNFCYLANASSSSPPPPPPPPPPSRQINLACSSSYWRFFSDQKKTSFSCLFLPPLIFLPRPSAINLIRRFGKRQLRKKREGEKRKNWSLGEKEEVGCFWGFGRRRRRRRGGRGVRAHEEEGRREKKMYFHLPSGIFFHTQTVGLLVVSMFVVPFVVCAPEPNDFFMVPFFFPPPEVAIECLKNVCVLLLFLAFSMLDKPNSPPPCSSVV